MNYLKQQAARELVEKKRSSKLTKGYKTGKAQKVADCCRMVRICPPTKLGEIVEALNTLTEEQEKWMLIKINKKNSFDSIVQRIF